MFTFKMYRFFQLHYIQQSTTCRTWLYLLIMNASVTMQRDEAESENGWNETADWLNCFTWRTSCFTDTFQLFRHMMVLKFTLIYILREWSLYAYAAGSLGYSYVFYLVWFYQHLLTFAQTLRYYNIDILKHAKEQYWHTDCVTDNRTIK